MFVSQRKTFLPFLPALIFLTFFGTGCITVKNFPDSKPFIFQTTVHVQGPFSSDEKKELGAQLEQQLDDSVKVRAVSKAAGWDNGPKLFYEVLNNPTLFDSSHAAQSILFMRSLLNSLGYFRDSSYYTTKIVSKSSGRQLRTQLDFYVRPGILTTIDSISYRLNGDTVLASSMQQRKLDTIQRITIDALPQAAIKKGDAFSTYKLSAERDRLASVYRNNGYLKFSEEELLGLWDTVGIELLRPTLDPIEQVTLLQERAKRRLHPVASVEFRLRDNPDTTRTIRYYIGKVAIYPEFAIDTTTSNLHSDSIGKYTLFYNQHLFKKNIFPDYIFINPGDLYRQSEVEKTRIKFNSLGAWRLVTIQEKPRPGQDTADFDIRLTPARKYSFNTHFEVALNQGNLALALGNLLGLGLTAGIQNHNFARGANQSATNVRVGTELNASVRNLIETGQITLGHTIQIPRLVPPFMRRFSRHKENTNATIFSLNGGITDRKNYYTLTTLNSSMGYQFGWKNKLLTLRFPNVEYNYLIKKDSLDTLIRKNASYKYIFNTGLIISGSANYSIAHSGQKTTSLTSFSAEAAGIPGFFKNAFATNFYRFLKVDAEFRETRKFYRNAFAWRVFGGIGFGFPGSSLDSTNRYLPFFREYFAGGPNSMRAWSVRKLGPGSSIRSFGVTDAPDRFGDIRLEGNAEYRFYLTNYKGITINSALYTDVGNVWFLRYNPDFPGGEFPNTFSKLWKDIGIGLGTGLRVDFGFLKVRVDYAYKVKNPNPETLAAQNRWFYGWSIFSGQVQLGIDYPF